MTRIIAHVDMDAFFASVEERDHPWMRGEPIVVGADPEGGKGRGVVSTANYAARIYGIHSAMPITEAWRRSEAAKKRCEPAVLFLGGNMSRYKEVSDSIMDIMHRYGDVVEQTSIDEAYIDLSFTGSFKKAQEVAEKIKKEIQTTEELTASVGIGPNKMIAKIASDMHKPDGLTVVLPDDVITFLRPLPVRKIPGVGPKAAERLLERGVRTIGELEILSESELVGMFGKWGRTLLWRAIGEDDSPLETEHETKSIGEQVTFTEDTNESSVIFFAVRSLAGDVIRRLNSKGFKGFHTVTVTIRFADFETHTHSQTTEKMITTVDELEVLAIKLITPFLDRRKNPEHKLIRLVGVRAEKLVEGE